MMREKGGRGGRRRRVLIRALLILVGVGCGIPGFGIPGNPTRSLKPARMEIAVRAGDSKVVALSHDRTAALPAHVCRLPHALRI